jgi:hypothetical protein
LCLTLLFMMGLCHYSVLMSAVNPILKVSLGHYADVVYCCMLVADLMRYCFNSSRVYGYFTLILTFHMV